MGRPLRYIPNLLRVLLAGTTLVLAAALFLVCFVPHLTNRLDPLLHAWYESHYEEQFNRAVELQSADPDMALVHMEEFAARLEEVRPGDRLAQMKQVLFSRMIQTSQRAGKPDRALQAAVAWEAFDPRDFNAKIARIEVLLATPETREEGRRTLADLAQRYPDVAIVRHLALREGLFPVSP